jgi:carbamoyltransferase|tara:strand:+ start:4101 stop:5405 length:1305 start_codon:yes stop_codon:yes gene_type:complete
MNRGKADWILGVNVAGHGSSICLLHHGKIVFFIKEERITGIKRDFGMPMVSVDRVTEYTKKLDWVIFANTDGADQRLIKTSIEKNGVKVDHFFQDDPHSTDYFDEYAYESDPELLVRNKMSTHHINHAASSYYYSPFDEATVVVMDGWGHVGNLVSMLDDDMYDGMDNVGHRLFEHVSIFSKILDNTSWENQWELLYKEVSTDGYRASEYEDILSSWGDMEDILKDHYENTIGFSNLRLASTISAGVMYESVTGYLGHRVENVGKIMGMAPYGKEDKNLPPLLVGPNLDSNANLFNPTLLLNDVVYPELKEYKDNFDKSVNLAYAVQKALEEKVIFVIEKAMKLNDCKNIALGGGVFHNIMVNGMLVEKYPDYNFFADPLCDDSGHSYGGAKLLYDQITLNHVKEHRDDVYLGHSYDVKKLESRVRKYIKKFTQ